MVNTKIKKNYTMELKNDTIIYSIVINTFEVIDLIEKTPRGKSKTEYKLIDTQKKVLKEYKLEKIDKKDIPQLKKSGVPGIIIKINNEYYYSKVKFNNKFYHIEFIKPHLCANCMRLSALPDELGGCKKVRERKKSMERYPFIFLGYETFNTSLDCFTVCQCCNYEPYEEKRGKNTKI